MKIKVIKITKSWSARTTENYIIVNKEDSDRVIEWAVQDWCNSDSGGQSNGYSYDWSEVTDINEVRKALVEEDKRTTCQLVSIKEKSLMLRESLIEVDSIINDANYEW